MSHINLIIRSLLLLALVAPSALAASVSVVPSGNSSSFSVEGVGIDGVSGIQIEIAYDPASLSTPLVTRGRLESGALFSENHSSRGVIKIAVIKNSFFSGGGQIAAISFASKTGKGGITSVTYNIINDSGSSVASSPINSKDASASEATVNTFSLTTQSAQSTQSTQATPPTATASSTAAYLGAITLPTGQEQRVDYKPAQPSTPTPAPASEQPAAKIAEQIQTADKSATDLKMEDAPQYVVYKGIINRFKQYTGSKKLSDIVALFDKTIVQTITQEPAILLNDGKSKATLTIEIPARINYSPNFAVNGGKLLSFKQDQSTGHWTIDVMPETGSVKVAVTIIAGARRRRRVRRRRGPGSDGSWRCGGRRGW